MDVFWLHVRGPVKYLDEKARQCCWIAGTAFFLLTVFLLLLGRRYYNTFRCLHLGAFTLLRGDQSYPRAEICRLIRYTTVYITPPSADFPRFMVVPPPVAWCRCQKARRWKRLAESFPKTYRSALAPYWLLSNRAGKNAPGGGDIYNVVYASFEAFGIPKWCSLRAGSG